MTFPQLYQQELIELTEIAGISAAPGVFGIMLDLLALQVSPEEIYRLLKQVSMTSSKSPSQLTTDDRNVHVSVSSVKK